tara:strand:+ start:1005 stop:1661 length:657 start_codon:yes stop_codon:yes gene_type:complete
MAGLTIATEPTVEPVQLQEVKDYLKIEDSVDERLLRPFIQTARRFAEEHLRRTLMQTTYNLFLDSIDEMETPLTEGFTTGPYMNFYKDHIALPKSPVSSVTSVSTFSDDDTETTFAASKYFLDNVREPARIVLRTGETFPSALRVANAIKVVYVAGYSSAYAIPEPIRLGILQLIAYLYEHRGDMYEGKTAISPVIRHLFAPYVIHEGLSTNSYMAIG